MAAKFMEALALNIVTAHHPGYQPLKVRLHMVVDTLYCKTSTSQRISESPRPFTVPCQEYCVYAWETER